MVTWYRKVQFQQLYKQEEIHVLKPIYSGCYDDPNCRQVRPCATWDIPLKRILNSNLAKFRSSITYFGSDTTVLCANFQNDFGQIKRMSWTDEISRDLSLRWVSDGYSILHSSPVYYADHALIYYHLHLLTGPWRHSGNLTHWPLGDLNNILDK